MKCIRCAGLIFEIHETLETYPTVIHACMNCGWRLYPAYQPTPMRPLPTGPQPRGRGRKHLEEA